jgi:predicted dehydrogenase
MGRLAEICHASKSETAAGAARIMSETVAGVGIIGCGVISAAYLKADRLFPQIEIRALADLDLGRAQARSAEFGPPACTVPELLADPAIDIVLNLTIPAAHVAVALQAVAAGKHVYGEKPLAISVEEARRLLAAAEQAGVRIGCAPDTFLGGGHQTARRLIDQGAIGEPFGGTAFLMLPGHERWHPDPDFYYVRAGGGPMFDMGPYYITDLVQLLGSVAKVVAFGTVGRSPRVIRSGPRAGTKIPVECMTHIVGVLQFDAGAVVQIATSFEVWCHKHTPIEIYGTEGSLAVPDPNRFGGEVGLCPADGEWQAMPQTHGYADDNYRILGLVDMAVAIAERRPHRASGDLACHVLEVMAALVGSCEGGGVMAIESRCARPEPMTAGLRTGEMS